MLQTMYSVKEIKQAATRKREAWWMVLVMNRIAVRLLWVIANYTKATPNQITTISLILSIPSAFCFLQNTFVYSIIGAFLFETAFLFDCMDGKLARLRGSSSNFGAYYDLTVDRFRIVMCSIALGKSFSVSNSNVWIYVVIYVLSIL